MKRDTPISDHRNTRKQQDSSGGGSRIEPKQNRTPEAGFRRYHFIDANTEDFRNFTPFRTGSMGVGRTPS
jgi:hypothetical protein